MKLSFNLLKSTPELLFAGLFILAFAVTNTQLFLLVVVLIGITVAAVFPFGRGIQFLLFLLPCSAVFTQSTYLPISLATLVFLAVFGRYILTQVNNTQYHKSGLIFTFCLIAFELMHIIYNSVMVSTQTIRWLILFVFVALLIFDRNKYIDFTKVRYSLLLGLLFSTGYGLLVKYFHPEVLVNGNLFLDFLVGQVIQITMVYFVYC